MSANQANPRFVQILRVLLIAVYVVLLVSYIRDKNFVWFMDNFNLLIHEGGHVFFGYFGETIGVMGGTLFQILIPIFTVFVFIKQNDYFSISFSLFWIGTNMFNIARYVGDAQVQLLPLVHMGSGDPIHDWYYLLSHFGLLQQSAAIANAVYAAGYTLLLCAIGIGIYFSVCYNKRQ
jgi:hypothetical protein